MVETGSVIILYITRWVHESIELEIFRGRIHVLYMGSGGSGVAVPQKYG